MQTALRTDLAGHLSRTVERVGNRGVRPVLFVVFHYPPQAGSSGVLRTLKYTRYLGAHGWRITVLTLERGAYEVQDPGLERQIPVEARVVQTGFLSLCAAGLRPKVGVYRACHRRGAGEVSIGEEIHGGQ